MVDRLIRVESLEREWPSLLDALGIDDEVPLEKRNTSERRFESLLEYLQPGDRELIFQRYQQDFEVLGYEFE